MATKAAAKKTTKTESRADRLRRNMTNQRGRTLFKKYTADLKAAFNSGKNYIRILPWDVKDVEAPPMVAIAMHFNIAGEVVPCLNVFEDGGGHCPVCAMIDKERGRMEKEEFNAWSSPIRATKRFAVWGVDLLAPKKGAKIYELPKKVGDLVFDKFNDEDDGVWWKAGNIYDFKIVKTGSGMTTNYDKSEKTTSYANVKTPKLDKPLVDLTKLFTLDDSTEEWQEYIKKLLARMNEEKDESDDAEASSDLVDDEEVSEEVEERSSKKSTKKKPAEEESEEASEEAEEEEEVESEEAEEESDEEPAPKKKKAPAKKKPADDESEEAEEEASEEASEEAEEDESEEVPESEEAEEDEEESEEAPKAKKKAPAKKKPAAEEESEEEEEVESDDAEEEESEEAEEEASEEAEEISEDEEEAEEESDEAPAPKKKKAAAPAAKKKITAAEMKKKLKNAKR